jgi:hypothetical protein
MHASKEDWALHTMFAQHAARHKPQLAIRQKQTAQCTSQAMGLPD